MQIALTGGTGFIGKYLTNKFIENGDEVVILTRNPTRIKNPIQNVNYIHWDPNDSKFQLNGIESSQILIHLAGEPLVGPPIIGRWTKSKKNKIYKSRVLGTQNLISSLKLSEHKIDTFIGMISGIGCYPDSGEKELDESSEVSNEWLSDIVVQSENSMSKNIPNNIRNVILRAGIVIGKDGGGLKRLLLPSQFGVLGKFGTGDQWWSWMDIEDIYNCIVFFIENEHSGLYNVTTQNPVRQKQFVGILSKILRRPNTMWFPLIGHLYKLALKIILGGVSAEVLYSRKINPSKLFKTGFTCEYPLLEQSIEKNLNLK